MNQACNPYSSFIVEASAGTGKTHLLIHRYLALVAAHAPIAEIIAVTFTVKAAHEMQERIIEEANKLLHSQDKQTSFNTALDQFYRQAALAVQEPKSATDVAREVLTQSQRMKVKTLDSLWQEWLTLLDSYDLQREVKHPITMLDDDDAEDMEKGVWNKLWQQLKNEPLGAEALQDENTTSVKNRVEALRKHKQDYRYIEHSEQTDDAKERATYRYLNSKGRIYAEVAKRLEKLYAQHKHNRYEFNDLLNVIHKVISANPEAQYVLEQRVAHILLDEFQDTNDKQWEVFKPLCIELMAGDNLVHSRRGIRSTVFIVGDKKQSIYAFRGSNPKIMTTAANDLSALKPQHLALQGNYRSTPHLISFFNQVFPKLRLTDYQPHEAMHSNDSSVVSIAVHKASEHKQSKEELVQLEANYVANRIQTLLNSKEMRAQDICILYRNQTHADKFAKALTAKSIKHCKHDDTHLLESQEIRDMVALCRWLLFAEDLQALMTVLRSQGVSASEALMLCDTTADQDIRSSAILAQLKNQRLATNLQLLQQHSHLPAHKLIAQAVWRYNFIAAYAKDSAKFNIIYFLEILTGLASKGVSSLAAVYERLSKNFITDVYKPSNAVNLMTMHKAKGLEFLCVFLVQAGDDWAKKTDNYWLRQANTIKYIGTTSDQRPLALAEQIKTDKQRRIEHEELRLLYVAMTRAKSHLMISGEDKHFLAKIRSAITEQKSNSLAFVATDSSATSRQPTSHDADSLVSANSSNVTKMRETISSNNCFNDTFLVMVSKFTATTSSTDCSATAGKEFSAAQSVAPLRSDSTTSRPDVQLFHASAKPTNPLDETKLLHTLRGDYAHKMLERAANAMPYADSNYWQGLLSGAGIVNVSTSLYQELNSAIDLFVKSNNWQNLFANSLWFKTEVQISHLNTNTLLNGIIDLLICYRSNKILVVDYKLGNIKDSYTEQLGRYAAAVKRIYPDHQIQTKVIGIKVSS